ncbi:unnamed protein product [Rhodiola kirilowii]
MDQEPESISHP